MPQDQRLTTLSLLKVFAITTLLMATAACTNVNKNMKVKDSNTTTQYFAISKSLYEGWKLNMSYLETEGGQSPTLTLNTELSEPSDPNSGSSGVRRTESFSFGNVNFKSPPLGGSISLGADYDLRVTSAEFQYTFSRAYPFTIGLSFGILFMDLDMNIYELAADNSQFFSHSRLHRKVGADFSYALHPKLSVNFFVGQSHDLEDVGTLQYGTALLLACASPI